MTAQQLKALLEHVPDDLTMVIEQPEDERYATIGARGDAEKKELLIEL